MRQNYLFPEWFCCEDYRQGRKNIPKVWLKGPPLLILSLLLLLRLILIKSSHLHFPRFLTGNIFANYISLSSSWDAFFLFFQLLAEEQLSEHEPLLMCPVDSSQPLSAMGNTIAKCVICPCGFCPAGIVLFYFFFISHWFSLESFTFVQTTQIYMWRTQSHIIIIFLNFLGICAASLNIPWESIIGNKLWLLITTTNVVERSGKFCRGYFLQWNTAYWILETEGY